MAAVPALSNPLGVCCMCARQAKGFVVKFNPIAHVQRAKTVSEIRLRREYPQFACCSTKCQDAVLKLVVRNRGEMAQETITAMEQKAIYEAKIGMHEALTRIGIAQAFEGQPPENMDYVVWTVWQALQASMRRQSEAGEIPL